jgi:hypothetical protein
LDLELQNGYDDHFVVLWELYIPLGTFPLTTPRTIMTLALAFNAQAFAFNAPTFSNSLDSNPFATAFHQSWTTNSEAMDIDSEGGLTQEMDEIEYTSPHGLVNTNFSSSAQVDCVMSGCGNPPAHTKRGSRRR